VDAIVMAAGEGRRMRPLTERWAKPVLPVDGRPVVGLLLRELARAGIERTFVVVGHLGDQIEALVGNGSAFGVEVSYATQPEALGSADAVRRALDAGAEAPALVTAADNVYRKGDVSRFRAAASGPELAGALAVRRGLRPAPKKPGVQIADGRVATVYDLDPNLALTAAPLWALGAPILPYLEDLSGPPFELAEAYQRAIDDGRRVDAVEIAPPRDITSPADVLDQNFPYLGAHGGAGDAVYHGSP